MIELKIDEEFRNKIPPLTADEFTQLEKNILEDGEIIEPIVVWNGTIIDGHNRWAIYQQHKILLPEPKILEKKFADRYEAIVWMCRNQVGRRNLDKQTLKKLVYQAYEAQKKHEGNSTGRNQHSKEELGETSKYQITRPKIAKDFGVTEGFVKVAVEVWQEVAYRHYQGADIRLCKSIHQGKEICSAVCQYHQFRKERACYSVKERKNEESIFEEACCG